MQEDIIFFTILIGYIFGGYYLTKYIRSKFKLKDTYKRFLILSFSYALIFGIGIAGSGGGEPGFALPFPIIIAGILNVWLWVPAKYFITGVIIPIIFWWTTIFFFLLVQNKILRNRVRKLESSKIRKESAKNLST